MGIELQYVGQVLIRFTGIDLRPLVSSIVSTRSPTLNVFLMHCNTGAMAAKERTVGSLYSSTLRVRTSM